MSAKFNRISSELKSWLLEDLDVDDETITGFVAAAQQAVEDGCFADAASVYALLSFLDEENEAYRKAEAQYADAADSEAFGPSFFEN
jgi:hypothetical protein